MQRIHYRKHVKRDLLAWSLIACWAKPCLSQSTQPAVLSPSAYRALGQPDLQQNGVNMVEAGTLAGPESVALDASSHLYVADTFNHRVQAWTSATTLQNGAPACIVLGQPSFQNSNALGIGTKGFTFPWSLAVDPTTGNLYVADWGNSRVLRFQNPFASVSCGTPTRVEPDAVYGQPDFNTRTPNSSGVNAHSMNGPRGIAFDSAGNLWVADTGNNRLLRFPAATLGVTNPSADLVLGQPDFTSSSPDRGLTVSAAGFDSPFSLTFDIQHNLYVSDFQNTRVLKFAAPLTGASVATAVYGEADFITRGVPQIPTASSMAGPTGIALDATGNLYVAVPNDNRVLVFAAGAKAGAAATNVLGQPDFTTTTVNTGAFPQASATSLSGALGGGVVGLDVKLDVQGNVLVADSGNNRVLLFPPGSKSATHVLGQSVFSGNGPNQIKRGSINSPFKIAVDYSHAPFALYVSDTNNNRVMVWKDAAHFRTGDPADLVIGQPDFSTAVPNVDSGGKNTPTPTALSAPRGLAVAADGTLYVSDSGNHRVLRYPRPVDQSGRITPDAVLGQTDFLSAASAAVSAATLHTPSGVAIGTNGNIFVADTGNNRVLEFSAGSSTDASAIRVYGQPTFSSGAKPTVPSAQTLSAPLGLAVDSGHNLYVADSGANRILVFPGTNSAPPQGLPASIVIGQSAFNTNGAQSGPAGLNVPFDVGLDSLGNIFICDTGNNRVVIFPSRLFLPTAAGVAYLVIGQPDLYSTAANWNTSNRLATPEGLAAPASLFVDRQDTLYVGDAGNNRVTHYLKPAVVVNGAHFTASVPVGLGAWSSAFGRGFSTGTQLASTSSLPTSLAGRELVVNDQIRATLYYVSPGQINFVFPSNATVGTQRIACRIADTGELLAGGPVIVAAYSPGFFTDGSTGTGQASALNQDNSINSPSNPAPRGTVVQLFGTGQGPVVSPVPDGQKAPSALDKTVAAPTSDASTCLNKQPAVCVALGGSGGGAVLAEIQYSGLAPGLIGVWQLNVKIPTDGLLGNTIRVSALIGGANQSNLVTVAIK